MQVLKQWPTEKNATGKEDTVLVVEDETSLLKVTTLILERLGYNVISASSPIEALSIMQSYEGTIDMLLTDVVMPEMSGLDLAEKLIASHKDLKCLYMSGYTTNVIADYGILDEGMPFINKPFSKRDLAIKVREVLDIK